MHIHQADTDLIETFSNNLLIEEYDVITGGTSVKFEPSYQATPQGLLVEHFLAHIQQPSNPDGPVQEMHVAIDYQTVEGFFISARLSMEVVGTGSFNITLDNCTVRRQ